MAAHLHHALDELLQEAASAAPRALLLAIPVSLVLLPPLLHYFFSSTPWTTSISTNDELLSMLPSPPTKLPIIGHLHLLMGDILPYVSLAGLAARHRPTVVVSSPRVAEAVLRTHDHVFSSRPWSLASDIIMYGATDSCFAPYGDHFRKAKEEGVHGALDKVRRAATACEAVDMSELLHSFANNLVCHAVSGKLSLEQGQRNRLFRELNELNATLLGGLHLRDYFPSLLGRIELVRKVACAKARRVRKRWDDLLDKLIDDHAARMATHQDEDDDKDFIYVLLSLQKEYGLTRDHIKAILIDMFEAGTDTSYVALEFAMTELIRKPHLMKKMQDEVRRNVPAGQETVTEDNLANMTYIKAVIKETLRLHPPVPLLLPHFSMETCEVVGYTIPANTRVVVNTWALGRHSGYWEQENEFMPERFLSGDIAGGVNLKTNEFQFLEFGSARRMCPGVHSASATLLHNK